jgi:hypothetical protein
MAFPKSHDLLHSPGPGSGLGPGSGGSGGHDIPTLKCKTLCLSIFWNSCPGPGLGLGPGYIGMVLASYFLSWL